MFLGQRACAASSLCSKLHSFSAAARATRALFATSCCSDVRCVRLVLLSAHAPAPSMILAQRASATCRVKIERRCGAALRGVADWHRPGTACCGALRREPAVLTDEQATTVSRQRCGRREEVGDREFLLWAWKHMNLASCAVVQGECRKSPFLFYKWPAQLHNFPSLGKSSWGL